MNKKISILFLCLLAACGGGSSSSSGITHTSVEGNYSGTVNFQTSTCPFTTANKLDISDIVTVSGTTATITIADGTQYTTPVTSTTAFNYHFDRTANLGDYGICTVVNTLNYANLQQTTADVTLDTSYTCNTISCVATWFGTITRN